MKPLTLVDFLRIQYIHRWVIIATHRHQSVAEHSNLVSIITWDLGRRLGLDETSIARAVTYAALHDVAEVATGDIVTPLKRHLTQHYSVNIDAIEHELCPDITTARDVAGDIGCTIVKLADTLEAKWHLEAVAMGSHARSIIEQMDMAIEKTLRAAETMWADLPWRQTIKDVITEVAAPNFGGMDR